MQKNSRLFCIQTRAIVREKVMPPNGVPAGNRWLGNTKVLLANPSEGTDGVARLPLTSATVGSHMLVTACAGRRLRPGTGGNVRRE